MKINYKTKKIKQCGSCGGIHYNFLREIDLFANLLLEDYLKYKKNFEDNNVKFKILKRDFLCLKDNINIDLRIEDIITKKQYYLNCFNDKKKIKELKKNIFYIVKLKLTEINLINNSSWNEIINLFFFKYKYSKLNKICMNVYYLDDMYLKRCFDLIFIYNKKSKKLELENFNFLIQKN